MRWSRPGINALLPFRSAVMGGTAVCHEPVPLVAFGLIVLRLAVVPTSRFWHQGIRLKVPRSLPNNSALNSTTAESPYPLRLSIWHQPQPPD